MTPNEDETMTHTNTTDATHTDAAAVWVATGHGTTHTTIGVFRTKEEAAMAAHAHGCLFKDATTTVTRHVIGD